MAQLHSLLTANHRPYAAVYADATERLAATGFVRALGGGTVAFTTDDLYKKALQLDNASEWILTAITPTWVQVGLGGSTGVTDNAALRANGTGGSMVQGSNLIIPDDAVATEVGYMNIPQRSSSTDTTTLMADRGGHLYHPVSDDNPRTFTIDSNANVAYPIGTAITFINDQNTLTIAITSDTLVWAEDGSTGSRTLAENGMATAVKVTSTRWIISGTGLT